MKRKINKIIPLLFSSIGLMLSVGLLTLGFSIYQGGSVRAASHYVSKDKSIISVSSISMTDWSELAEIKDKLMLDDDIIVSSEMDISLSTDMKTVQLKAIGISSSYWNTENKKILYGRLIDAEDVKHAKPVMVINEKAALDLYDTRDVLDKRVDVYVKGDVKSLTIIGVVKEPFYNQEPACFIPYNIYSANYYKERIISIVVPQYVKNDAKEKAAKLMHDKYKSDPKKVFEYKQLLFIENWLKDNLAEVGIIILISTLLGISVLVFGLDNYIYKIRDRLELLKTFGISDDKIKIKLFNRLCIFEIIPFALSILIGYVCALVLGKYLFIKPIISIKHIIIIFCYGLLFVMMAVLISFRKLNSFD